jgi:hypothetical protein
MIQRRPLELWGSVDAEMIMRAPMVEALLLAEPGTKVGGEHIEAILIDGTRWIITERREVARSPGFSHLRAALMNDHSFVWDAPAEATAPRWEYGLTFTDGNAETTLIFAPNVHRVRLLTGKPEGHQATLAVMPGIERFMLEQLGTRAAK